MKKSNSIHHNPDFRFPIGRFPGFGPQNGPHGLILCPKSQHTMDYVQNTMKKCPKIKFTTGTVPTLGLLHAKLYFHRATSKWLRSQKRQSDPNLIMCYRWNYIFHFIYGTFTICRYTCYRCNPKSIASKGFKTKLHHATVHQPDFKSANSSRGTIKIMPNLEHKTRKKGKNAFFRKS